MPEGAQHSNIDILLEILTGDKITKSNSPEKTIIETLPSNFMKPFRQSYAEFHNEWTGSMFPTQCGPRVAGSKAPDEHFHRWHSQQSVLIAMNNNECSYSTICYKQPLEMHSIHISP